MTEERRNRLIVRWSIFTAALIAAFWAIFLLTTGSVPIVESIRLTDTLNWDLPFGVSRWFDVFLGPIYAVTVIQFFYLVGRIGQGDKEDILVDLAGVLVFSLAAGLVLGLTTGLVFGLAAVLAVGFVVGLVDGLVLGLAVGLATGLTAVLGVGLIALARPLVKWLTA